MLKMELSDQLLRSTNMKTRFKTRYSDEDRNISTDGAVNRNVVLVLVLSSRFCIEKGKKNGYYILKLTKENFTENQI